ncbi:MAG: hypothetical protein IK115_01060 [Lachnospiraceae bacterium]|nr:hypothetical protein [Lachnospiraceae bacterium]
MKKKILAFVLSAAMLTESVLPVIAADDVTLSADEVIEAEASEEAAEEEEAAGAEEAAIEETEDAEAAAESTEAADSIEAYMVDGKFSAEKLVASLEAENAVVLGVTEKDGEVIVDMAYQFNAEVPTEVSEFEEADGAETGLPYYMDSANPATKIYDLGDFDVKGQPVKLTAIVNYNDTIWYRNRKFKPVDHLYASVSQESGIYNVAKALMPEGYTFNPEVIKWKFTPKKNKYANSESRFIVKGTVSSKIAKQMGIKGKDLKILKKAMKTLNKEMKYVKKKAGIDNRVPFTIKPLVFNDIVGNMWIQVKSVYTWGSGWKTTCSGIYARLETSQPESNWKKWTKIPKKEYSYRILNNGNRIEVTPKGKNVVGTMIPFERRL